MKVLTARGQLAGLIPYHVCLNVTLLPRKPPDQNDRVEEVKREGAGNEGYHPRRCIHLWDGNPWGTPVNDGGSLLKHSAATGAYLNDGGSLLKHSAATGAYLKA